VRFVLGAAFWLHALFFLKSPPPYLALLATRLSLTANEVAILILIVLLSALTSGGYLQLLKDVLYVYAFPLILLYLAGKYVWSATTLIARHLGPSQTPMQIDQAENARAELKLWIERELSSRSRRIEWSSFWEVISRPFTHFLFLWLLLLWVATNRVIQEVALTIALFQVALRLLTLSRLSSLWKRLLDRCEIWAQNRTEELLADLSVVTQETRFNRKLYSKWKQLRGLWQITESIRESGYITKWARRLGVLFYVCLYIYVALLFACTYWAIARYLGIPYSFLQAFVTSLVIPVAYTILPNNVWIHLCGAVQWLLIVVGGIVRVTWYLKVEFLRIAATASNISRPFQDDDVKEKLVFLENKFDEWEGR
jgi:hypothetical protein